MATTMMNQLAFDYSPPHNGTDTSRAAAQSIKPHLARLEVLVLAAIHMHGDATCDELEVFLGLAHQTCSARINKLVELGEIEDTGKRRPTRSGRMARVYARCS